MNRENKYKKRKSQFELLRIIAMFLIVLSHANIHGVLENGNSTLLKYPFSTAVSLLMVNGVIGVYIFVLITGYFMINSKISYQKIIKLWLPIVFWSLILYLTFNWRQIQVIPLIKSIFPVIFNQYWFMTVYFLMYCLIPILNKVVVTCITSRNKYYFLILGEMLILTSCPWIFGKPGIAGSNLINFCVVYCFGGVIGKTNILQNENIKKRLLIIFDFSVIFTVFIIPFLVLMAFKLNKLFLLKIAKLIVIPTFSWLAIIIALGIFIKFAQMKINFNFFINKIASLTLGIYLISDNNYVRSWIWIKIFNLNSIILQSPIILVGKVLLIAIVVFGVSALLEYVRQTIFNLLTSKIIFS